VGIGIWIPLSFDPCPAAKLRPATIASIPTLTKPTRNVLMISPLLVVASRRGRSQTGENLADRYITSSPFWLCPSRFGGTPAGTTTKPSQREWARQLGVSHTWLQKLVRRASIRAPRYRLAQNLFQLDACISLRLQEPHCCAEGRW
jgi:hypothetical protein